MIDKIKALINLFSFRLAKSMSRISSKIYWLLLSIIIVIALAASLKGTLGEIVSNMISPVGMSLYLQDSGSSGSGWLIVVAYILGLFFFSGIFISLITNYLRETGKRYNFGTLKHYHWKNHILFLGYDELMIGTLKKAYKEYNQIVVAIPDDIPQTRDLLLKHLGREIMKKVEVLQCNPTDLSDLTSRACILTAKRIFVIGSPDDPVRGAQNLKSMVIMADRLKNGSDNKVPHIMVYLRNQATFTLIRRQGFNAVTLWRMIDKEASQMEQTFLDKHCEFFNFHYDLALHMLSAANGIRPCWPSDSRNIHTLPNAQVHLVVMGITDMGRPLVREAIKLAHPSGEGTRFRITMVDSNARTEMYKFIGRTKELFQRCRYSFTDYDNPARNFEHIPEPDILDIEFEFIQCDLAHPMLTDSLSRWAHDQNQLLTLVICSDDSPKNMAVATYLPGELLNGDSAFPIWIFQNGDDSMKHMLDPKIYGNLHPFSMSNHYVEDTATSEKYSSARAIASFYNKNYGDNSSLKWEEIPSPNRWSSIYSVLSMEIKMQAIGIKSLSGNIVIDDEKLLQRIDIIEHYRWMIERLCDGYIPTDNEQHKAVAEELKQLKQQYPKWDTDSSAGKKLDESRTLFNNLKNGNAVRGMRIHDDLRPFSELDEYTKYKDRAILLDYLTSMNNKDHER